jgi:hypothetical protein
MNLTVHFTLEEFTRSDTAVRLSIDQRPSMDTLQNIKFAAQSMEEVRLLLGDKPIHINSAYRSYALNKAIGSTPASDHLYGWAVDFVCPQFGTPQDICRALADCQAIGFDQVIFEGTWCHVSFKPTGRRSLLTAHFQPGKTTYTEGIA